MVRHIVMWKLVDFTSEEERDAVIERIKTGLEALVGVVPGLLYAHVGRGFNPNGFDLCLSTELCDPAALDGYQVHPAHVRMKEFIHTVIRDRAVCDWEE